MKLSDVFKKLGINIEDDIDTEDAASSSKDKEIKNDGKDSNDKDKSNNVVINVTTSEKEKVQGDEKEETVMDYSKIKFDNGIFDLSTVEDEGLKAVLKASNDYTKATANKVKIDSAINSKVAELKLNAGITKDVVLTMLDRSGIKVDGNGAVVGVDEAITSLKTAQAGLFVAEKNGDGNKGNSNNGQGNVNIYGQGQSTPVQEGFNPQAQASSQGLNGINNIYDAFEVEDNQQ